jgi:site-specific DNA recombinase
MVGNPDHGRLYYRCTASRDFVRQHQISHPPALYLREDAITGPVDEFLRQELTGPNLEDHLRRVAEAQPRAALAAYGDTTEIERLRQTIADADRKIDGYRATLDAGGDPALIAGWISEASATKKAAQARLGLTEAPPQRMSDDQLDAIAEAFKDLLGLLRGADPRDRAELYSRIGLRMTYQPGPETVMAEVCTPADLRVFDMCPEGDLNPHAR